MSKENNQGHGYFNNRNRVNMFFSKLLENYNITSDSITGDNFFWILEENIRPKLEMRSNLLGITKVTK